MPKQKTEPDSSDPVKKNTKKGRKEEHRIVKANDREFNAQFKYAVNLKIILIIEFIHSAGDLNYIIPEI